MNYRKFFIILIFFSSLTTNCSSWESKKWDLEYWQYFNWKNWEKDPYKLYTIGEFRLNRDITRPYYYKITENFAIRALPYLDLEVHYSFLYKKTRGNTRFTNTQRLEFEANPFVQWDNGFTLKWRNRLELLKKQEVSTIQFVFRHRIMAIIPLENTGKLTSLHIYDEVFYDFDTHKFTQNRFVPVELSFELTPKTRLNVFFMVRNFVNISSNEWFRSFVLGSNLEF